MEELQKKLYEQEQQIRTLKLLCQSLLLCKNIDSETVNTLR